MFDWTMFMYGVILLWHLSLLFYIVNEKKVRGWWKKVFPNSKDSPLRGKGIHITIGNRKG